MRIASEYSGKQDSTSLLVVKTANFLKEAGPMTLHGNYEVQPADASVSDGIVERAVAQVRQMLETGLPQFEILARLAMAGEMLAGPGAAVSILVLDDEGLLRNGASPNLPRDYLNAIDPLKPDANIGTCAVAAATGSVVITPDLCADNKWAELRHLPLALEFVAAWSMPIKASDGTVLGTFGTYFKDRRIPTPEERSGVENLASLAALVLSRT